MKAHRWFNIVEMPMIPILFAGLWSLYAAIPTHWTLPGPSRLKWLKLPLSTVGLVAALVGYAAAEVNVSYDFSRSPETSVNDVHRRVRYMTFVQNRLDLDHVTLLDVDMGAHVLLGWTLWTFWFGGCSDCSTLRLQPSLCLSTCLRAQA